MYIVQVFVRECAYNVRDSECVWGKRELNQDRESLRANEGGKAGWEMTFESTVNTCYKEFSVNILKWQRYLNQEAVSLSALS